ncbi:peptidoglycan-binding protein [Polycladomyces subterraneus]|uniref:Peptidoglycan-binding protein n=1 Tax=Polycladomyces subterraneus TaxID=1016997 RepID=A0ABT8IP25_9BACL|nr:peptidoglycan-binding protein [Polycladomyces subterraneus]
MVLLVQNRLRAAGYYHGPMDGLFGAGLEEAVKRYQRDHRLKVTAQIQLVEYLQLGLWE